MNINHMKIGAIILIVVLAWSVGIVGAHEASTNATFGFEPMDGFWWNDGKPVWTYVEKFWEEHEPPEYRIITINATTDNQTYGYLTAYNLTLGGDVTSKNLKSDEYDIRNTNPKYLATSIATNNLSNLWRIASTVTQSGTETLDKVNSSKIDIVNITLMKKAFDEKLKYGDIEHESTPYTIKVLKSSEIGLEETGSVVDTGFDNFAKDISDEETSFTFHVRQAKPQVDCIFVEDYIIQMYAEDKDHTIYIYKEHGNVEVDVNPMGQFINDTFDTVDWEIYESSELYYLDHTYGKVSNITFHDNGRMADVGDESITKITVNKLIHGVNVLEAEDECIFRLNITNWNRSKTTNTQPVSPSLSPSPNSPTGRDKTCWDFETGLSVNYTVGAASMLSPGKYYLSTEPWDSHVRIDPLVIGEGENMRTITDWNATVHYTKTNYDDILKKFEINGVEIGHQLRITPTTNFTVSKNAIANGSSEHDVIITLSGNKKGDADMDGHVDIVDSSIVGITVIRNGDYSEEALAASLIPPTMENFIYADCNCAGGNGNIDVSDVRAINRYLVGLDPWVSGAVPESE